MLDTLNLKFKYDSDSDNLIDDFYIPVLSNSIEYYRMSGFFSSTSLAISAQGIGDFIRNDGKMKLLCSAELSEEDFQIIEKSNKDPLKFIEESFISDLNNIEDEFVKNYVEALGWMIAKGSLEIKIAIPSNKKGIFHSKIGIFKDLDGNILSFSGSDNETAHGWLYNIEEFKVFKSWNDTERKFVESDLNDFNKYWMGNTNKTNIYELPEAIKKELIKFAPPSKEDLSILESKKQEVIPGIKLRDYQKEALDSWFDNKCNGIFEMATGTGKTFTALSCFKKLSDSKERLLTVIACPQSHLIDQWVKDVEKFHDNEIVIASGKNYKWKKDFKQLMRDFYMGFVDNAVVMTTHVSLSSDFFIDCIQEFEVPILLIVDEVHGIGSSKQMFGLNECYDYRLGLSATPKRWFDEDGTQVIEDFFKGVVFEFDIERALTEINPDTGKTYLTPYIYNPIITDLNNEEYEKYYEYSYKIASLLNSEKKSDGEKLTKFCMLRQNIVNNAESKFHALRKILTENNDIEKLIVFCSPQQIDRVQNILTMCGIIPQHKFTQAESANKSKKTGVSEREIILSNFNEGKYRALVAIKCLDEGVDVPSAENAIIMSSTSNPREHVQRRGRILRRFSGKEEAVIYDLLVFPEENTDAGSKILKKEIDRYREFATNAKNSDECLKNIRKYYSRLV